MVLYGLSYVARGVKRPYYGPIRLSSFLYKLGHLAFLPHIQLGMRLIRHLIKRQEEKVLTTLLIVGRDHAVVIFYLPTSPQHH